MASTIRGDDNFDSSVVGSKTSRGAVGSYAFCIVDSGGYGDDESDRAGSGIRRTNVGTQGNNPNNESGTWRCMGYIHGNGTATGRLTVWLRIS